MNHCILGGLGDGDGGEDAKEGGSGAGAGAGDSFPAAGIMGEHRPLAPFLHGFLGALPYGDPWERKNVALAAANSWVEVSPTNWVSSLYIASRIPVTPS